MPYNERARTKVKLTNMTLSGKAALSATDELLYPHSTGLHTLSPRAWVE